MNIKKRREKNVNPMNIVIFDNMELFTICGQFSFIYFHNCFKLDLDSFETRYKICKQEIEKEKIKLIFKPLANNFLRFL